MFFKTPVASLSGMVLIQVIVWLSYPEWRMVALTLTQKLRASNRSW
jgi:hypothetical protein